MSTAENRGQKRPPPRDDEDGGGKRPAAAGEEEPDMCWLCHEDGPDESGNPLMRDCSCRGGSGWAHLPCIVGHAKHKTEQCDGEDLGDLSEPWRKCPSCRQDYQNELAVDLGNEFVSFVEEKYPDDHRRHVWALDLKPDTKIMPEGSQVSIKILSGLIGYYKAAMASPPKDMQKIEARVYSRLGQIALRGGTKDSAKSAMGYFEKCRDICEASGATTGVATAESNLAVAKAKYEGGSAKGNKEVLEKYQKVYQQNVENFGQENSTTIKTGLILAGALKGAYRGIEAERLMTKLVAICKRVHGTEHDITKSAKSKLQICKIRTVNIKHQNESKLFQALRYEEDGGKIVVKGPIAQPRNIQAEQTLTVAVDDIVRCAPGTPFICDGLKKATRLNGKIGDLRYWDEDNECYKVHFEGGGLESMRAKFLRILFELPKET